MDLSSRGRAPRSRGGRWLRMVGMGALLGAYCASPSLAAAQASPESPTPRVWWQFGLKDYVADETVLLNLGHAWSQSSDAGEVLETAARIDVTDDDSWTREWLKTAERLEAVAKQSEAAHHPISAGHAHLRAATYFRAALHRNMHPGSPEVTAVAARMRDHFERYLALHEHACRPVSIPYESTTLPAYWCPASRSRKPAPVVIFNSGRDVWAEDAKLVAEEANRRGYHALLFDGPGQGKALRIQKLTFRPDWDKVVGAVIDFAVAQRGVDARRLVLWGESMGGYLAPRAAAFEHRLKLVIANPGVIDWYRTFENNLEAMFPGALDLFETDEAAFDAQINQIIEASSFARWGLEDFYWKHGVSTPSQLVHDLQRYRLGADVKKIRAHMLVVDAEEEDRGQAQELYDALPGKKDFLMFTAAETAQFHDQPGAKAIASQRVYDWIDDNL